MASTFLNPLFALHVDSLWESLLMEFGGEVNYWPGGDPAQAALVEVVWIEGAEDEERSPGRYSHALIRNADPPAPPAKRDVIEHQGSVYDVVQVNAFRYGYSRVILRGRN